MRTVTVSADIDATSEDVFAELSPRSIIEYERTYDVDDVVETDEGWLLTAVSTQPGIEMELFFEESPHGFTYELVSGGPFEELHTTVTVHGDATDGTDSGGVPSLEIGERADGADAVRVTMTSEYTFGGRFSWLTDWLATGERERELERALIALAGEVGAVDLESDGSEADDASSDGTDTG